MSEEKINYFNAKDYISSSLIKATANHPKEAYNLLHNLNEKKSKALSDGSLTDCMLTTPTLIEETYKIYRGKMPTDKMLEVALAYISLKERNPDTTDELLKINARHQVGYNGNLKQETYLKKFDEECLDYVSFMQDIGDSVAISEQTYNESLNLSNKAKESPYLAHLMYPESNTLILYQVPLYVTTTRFSGKCLLDLLQIDHNLKEITPYDYKTFGESFLKTYWTYKYYYQEAWYTYLLELICNHREDLVDMNIPEELMACEGYKINQFKFIALDKTGFRNPEIFQNNHHIYEDIFFDNMLNVGQVPKKVKPISELIDEIKWRVVSGNWEDDYDMILNRFKLIQ